MTQDTDHDELRAQKQFLFLNLLRLASLGLLLTGIAITQDAIRAPYWAGIIMTVIGVGGFFFGPPLLARRLKAQGETKPDPLEKP